MAMTFDRISAQGELATGRAPDGLNLIKHLSSFINNELKELEAAFRKLQLNEGKLVEDKQHLIRSVDSQSETIRQLRRELAALRELKEI